MALAYHDDQDGRRTCVPHTRASGEAPRRRVGRRGSVLREYPQGVSSKIARVCTGGGEQIDAEDEEQDAQPAEAQDADKTRCAHTSARTASATDSGRYTYR